MSRSRSSASSRETFVLGPFIVPRIWVGLWQLSSNAWGSAPAARIRQGMARHAELGYNAFGASAFQGPPTLSDRCYSQTWCGILILPSSFSSYKHVPFDRLPLPIP